MACVKSFGFHFWDERYAPILFLLKAFMQPSIAGIQPLPTPRAVHVDLAVRRLVEHFDPLWILVFGSYARGEERSGSDLDLLVVLSSVDNKREAAVAMRRVLADLPVPKDIVVTTPEEVENRRSALWHVVGRALREGRLVYSSPGTP